MTQVPTNRTVASSIAEHTSDHNVFAAQHNELDGHASDTAAHDVDATIAAAIDALVDTAPGTLDTLNELAAALGDDANFASTVTTALAGKSATGHGHAEADVTSLVSDLAGKAATGHTHTGTYEPSGTIATHEADTTNVHGITDTSALALTANVILKALIDAAGDLLVGTADNTVGRLGLGSALQVLRVNAGATALEYATPSAGGGSDMTFARMAFR